MKKLFKWAKGHTFILILVLVMQFLQPATYSYVPQFIKYIIDIVLGRNVNASITLPNALINFFDSIEGVQKTILVVGVSLIIFQLLRAFLMFFSARAKGKFSEGVAYDLRTTLYNHLQELPYSYQNNCDNGDMIQRCTSDVDTIKGFLSANLPSLVYIVASLASGIYQMAKINVLVMLITLAVVPISLVTCTIYFKYQSKQFEKIEKAESDMTTVLQENVNAVRVVKAFNNEINEIDRFDVECKRYRDEVYKFDCAMAKFWGFSDGITMLQYGVTTIACIFLAMKGIVSTGDIISSLMYISMLVYPIRNLGRIIGDMGKAIVAAKRVDEILTIPSDFEEDGTEEPTIIGNISFKDVSFKFDDTDQRLLSNVSFDIKSGETVAIIGKTGSGKSTIAAILERMLEYESGSITLDGVELKDIKKRWVRDNVGIILQDPFLYARTIYDNIRIANMGIDSSKIYEAAKIASIDKEIRKFDSGYDTLVGEKGVTLSGGQKQRLAIARMLVLNKPIIIFDDSLSAVDTETDYNIRKALKQKDNRLTSIIITHRITTAKEADKIIVIENGKISNIGTHKELANIDGLYKSLWDIQGALEDEFADLVKKEVAMNE